MNVISRSVKRVFDWMDDRYDSDPEKGDAFILTAIGVLFVLMLACILAVPIVLIFM